ncbi:MAG: methyltransferase [Bacillota bacterium]|nr:methyltransferase [Bacillota bacterium]
MTEQMYEDLLHIKTSGNQKGFNQSTHYHRYEPTPYSALDILFQHYEVKSTDRIVDFGCGKGRLNFYIHYRFHATVIGIEMNKMFYQEAVENRSQYLKNIKSGEDAIKFYCCLAEEYQIDPLDNRFYFFNPFSLQIFIKIIKGILRSAENSAREIELVLYYPSKEYLFFLENHSSFQRKMEVKLPGLYEHNPNERFVIYQLKEWA